MPISNLVVFDSSLSDVGNVFRSSNGEVWVEQLATKLGVPLPTASSMGGTNFAYGGGSAGPGYPNVGWQIDQYLGTYTPSSSQLVLMSGGQNNFYDGEPDPAVSVAYVASHITTLANAGVENIMVLTLIPMGQVPALQSYPTEEKADHDQFASDFNALLVSEVANLRSTLSINVMVLDWHSLAEDMIANPASYGFTNVTDPAFDGVTVVPDPDQYMFWDVLHPTSAAHGFIAQQAYNVIQDSLAMHTFIVPEPSTLALLGLGLAGGFGVVARRRRAVR